MGSDTKATSIHQVAEHAAVSAATVSRVINGDSRISDATVTKVRSAMAELGYVPRPAAQRPGPRKRKTGRRSVRQIALISNCAQAALNSPIYSAVLDGVEAGAEEADVNLIFRRIRGSNSKLPTEISGAIIFGGRDEREIPSRLPCVRVMSQHEPDLRHDWVTYDDDLVGRTAADYLIAKECSSAVVVLTTRSDAPPRRIERFVDRCAEQGVDVVVFERHLMIIEENRQYVCSEQMAELGPVLKELKKRPTGLFITQDAFAPMAYAVVRDNGLCPEKDIVTVSVNNDRVFLDPLSPRPPSIDIHPVSIGKRAVEQLLWRIAHPKEPRVVLKVTPQLVS